MHSRKRTLIAIVFVVLLAASASAAPDGRSDSGDWIAHRIARIVQHLKKFFGPSPLEEVQPIPPKP